MTGPVWTVASAQTARRWAAAIPAALALAWSETVAVGQPEDAVGALERVGPDLVLLTSPNALAHLPPDVGAGLDAACVGGATARAARAAGFTVRCVGRGSGGDLARELIAAEEPGLILFLRGAVVRREGPDLLEAAGWRIEERVIYEARPRATFDAEVARAPDPSAVVVGSPSAASALARALGRCGRSALRDRPVVAIGETTARRLRSLSFAEVHAAEETSLSAIQRTLDRVVGGDPSP